MKTKRFMSILLSLVLVLGMFPGMNLTASAADTTTTITSPATTGTMTITLTIAAASVKTAPEANTLTYSGSAQTLTTTGEAGVGTLQYQLGESATTEPTGTWGTTVPQGTEAKDYYVWYRSRVNDNNISTAGCKTVTIAKASITNATVTLSDTSLVYTGSEQSVTVSSVKLGDTTLIADTDYEVTSGTTGTAKNTYTVTVTGKGNYKDTATAQWSIGLATPTIETIPTASAITYGQKLADSTLTGGVAKLGDTTVAGTFAWKNTETKPAVSDSNATEYDVVFTPTDADNYAAVECKVKLTVNKADPTVTAPPAKTLTYNGQKQELVNAGSTNDGKLYYAVTTENKAPTDESLYTTSIPTATNAGTYYVWYKVAGDASHLDSTPEVITVTIAATEANVTMAPAVVANLTYTGSDQELVTAGEAENGTLQYALGMDATTAPTSGWSTSIPKGTNAGTYYVWYKVVGDDNYTDSEAKCIIVVINQNEQKKEISSEGSVAMEDNSDTTKSMLVESVSSSASDEIKAAVANASTVEFKVVCVDSSSSATGAEDIQAAATKSNLTMGAFIDLSMQIWADGTNVGNLTDLNGKIKITVAIPESLQKKGRTFNIIRFHKGKTEIVGTGTGDTATVETDGFSTYAIVYYDEVDTVVLLKGETKGTGKIKLTWSKVSGATGYTLYGAKCGSKMKEIKTFAPAKTSYVAKNLKDGKSYKYYVVANGVKDASGENLRSLSVHIMVGDGGKKGNPTKVTAKSKVTVKTGKKAKLGAKVVMQVAKTHIGNGHCDPIRYISSDESIATVTKSGMVKGVKAGSCKVYAVASNGVRKKITVTVK